ncbi:putative domain HDIG-containing protein [Desulfitobacterium dichloroeliminans LMG P-21439]|uniref:Putative domain HDIG-containing protein n=1 Tax=Desulfitobacterium dichloroeliminans (strain LMG P-21439 / DCA1) TaxID=871963 RepID=L0F5W6_DESDL|nr:HD-GYP domain-containing protein [Desulfitobacterium dichloroeliminans]AGA68021.1 putative domain HDIG-containing protein [Desulfitobacterium dichloroeliminans LMG P-21439]
MKELPSSFKKLFYVVVTLGLGLSYWFISNHSWQRADLLGLLAFALLAVISESLPVSLPKGGYVTVGYAIFMTCLILFPIGVTIPIVLAAGILIFGKAGKEQLLYKRIFNASQYVISISFAYLIFNLFNAQHARFDIVNLISYFVAAFSYSLLNVTIVSITLGALFDKSPWYMWRINIRWSIPNFLALAPLAILTSMIYREFGVLALFLLFIPLLLARHSFQLYMDMRKNYLNTVEALVTALEAKDSYTSGHSSRVAEWSAKIAEELKLAEDRVEFIKYAGVLHDVGKIGVSEDILNKKGQLTESEWTIIRNHSAIGEQIVHSIDFLFDVSSTVRSHHERFDGNGYPDRIKGKDIPLESRIIALADAYDAMTSSRSYRESLSPAEALIELRRVSGSQLDPDVVVAFDNIMQRENPQEQQSPRKDVQIVKC